jgi:hypothetical protein
MGQNSTVRSAEQELGKVGVPVSLLGVPEQLGKSFAVPEQLGRLLGGQAGRPLVPFGCKPEPGMERHRQAQERRRQVLDRERRCI